MGDAGSGRSEPPSTAIPPRCPCGFWGSSKTLNRCSKCFADIQKKEREEERTPKSALGTGNSQSDVFCSETSGGLGQSVAPEAALSEEAPPGEAGATSSHVSEGNVFCMLHRLPEQHDCLFDHLGRGRQDAVLKMVKMDRKVGRTCQRIGEECS
ncbi:hypothetical protein NHX12_005668 [Muraenolepis orangiensis]|uniref:A20-type domain-containing protein n=1 Tax=Muraenolepis orangiensis TaxID=630683 RepID=A0A9Q0DRY8_9TELE|nr:hypothetical protein NHX12_005668 [Muraenolepis orangiensis]